MLHTVQVNDCDDLKLNQHQSSLCCGFHLLQRTMYPLRLWLCAVCVLCSQQFHSKNGPAWLFQTCINVLPGPKEERLMTTGMHIVADIACAKCLNVVGWKYVSGGLGAIAHCCCTRPPHSSLPRGSPLLPPKTLNMCWQQCNKRSSRTGAQGAHTAQEAGTQWHTSER